MTETEPMADVRDMYMAHAMMRREFTLLPQLIRDVRPGDRKRAGVVGEHAAIILKVLTMHHEGEDKLVWPRLEKRGGAAAAAVVPLMEAQHHVIEENAATATRQLATWRTDGRGAENLAATLDRLRVALLEHMTTEEQEILPLAAKYMTQAEWNELGESGLQETPKKQLPLTFGMVMYEGDPEVVRGVLAAAPPPVRVLMPILGRRAYARHAKRVYGTATPPRFSRQ